MKIVNVFGHDGIGKTRFVEEVGYQINKRYHFLDGIFLIDLRKAKSIEKIKKQLKEINIGSAEILDLNEKLQNKNILLILDNVDAIVKHSKT